MSVKTEHFLANQSTSCTPALYYKQKMTDLPTPVQRLPTASCRSLNFTTNSSNLYTFTADIIWRIFQHPKQYMIAFNKTWLFYKKLFPNDNSTWLTFNLIAWIFLLQCYTRYKTTILQYTTIWKYMSQKSFVYTIFRNSSSDSCKIIIARKSSEWFMIVPLISRQVTDKSH